MDNKYILEEIKKERVRQHEKHGEQNIPSWHPDIKDPEKQLQILRLMSEEIIKQRVDTEAKSNTKNWSSIALEEFIEAVAAPTDYQRRSEIIQCAAVLVQWIECLDRNNLCEPPILGTPKFTDETPMPFGKYKGVLLGNVPAEYLLYLNSDNLADGLLKDYIKENLDQLKAGI